MSSRTVLNRRGTRGSILILGMVVAAALMALSLVFARRIETNEVAMEKDIAVTMALQTAAASNSLTLQEVWYNYNLPDAAGLPTRRTDLRVAWLAGEDLNGNGGAIVAHPTQAGEFIYSNAPDPGEDVNYDGYLNAPSYNSFAQGVWVAFGSGQVKTDLSIVDRYAGEWVDVQISTTARVENRMTGQWMERGVRKVVRYGLAPSQVFDFVYFANNLGWMYGAPLYLYGGMGANGDLHFQGGPTVDGTLFCAKNPALEALGQVIGEARHDTVAQYQAMGAGNPLLRPSNPAAPSEDANGNGVLDAGEDLNGNGALDTYEYEVGYDGQQPRLEGQNQIYMPYLGDLQFYQNIAAHAQPPARPDIGEYASEDANGNGVLDVGEDLNANGIMDPLKGGVVKQLKAPGLDPTVPGNYNIIVDHVYGDEDGENGMYTTIDGAGKPVLTPIPNKINPAVPQQKVNGNLALIGTAAQPLVIRGPVVVTNDLVIKGVVKGQGTFYVGRNTHILNDLTYSDAPQWQQNDTNFFGNGVLDAGEDANSNGVLDPGEDRGTTEVNKEKDAVGYATKGSVILGNYTRTDDNWGDTRWYMGNAFTKSYGVDAADADLGYCTGTDENGQPTFHGNYTAVDNVGKKYNDDWTMPGETARKFYDSSFPYAYINSIQGDRLGKPRYIQGIFYTNHLFSGRTDNLELYGAMVCRDEAIVTNSTGTFTYDPRIAKGEMSSYIELFLPRDSAMSTRLWSEFEPVQQASERMATGE